MKKIIIPIVVLVLVLAGVFLVMRQAPEEEPEQFTPPTIDAGFTKPTPITNEALEMQINLDRIHELAHADDEIPADQYVEYFQDIESQWEESYGTMVERFGSDLNAIALQAIEDGKNGIDPPLAYQRVEKPMFVGSYSEVVRQIESTPDSDATTAAKAGVIRMVRRRQYIPDADAVIQRMEDAIDSQDVEAFKQETLEVFARCFAKEMADLMKEPGNVIVLEEARLYAYAFRDLMEEADYAELRAELAKDALDKDVIGAILKKYYPEYDAYVQQHLG